MNRIELLVQGERGGSSCLNCHVVALVRGMLAGEATGHKRISELCGGL